MVTTPFKITTPLIVIEFADKSGSKSVAVIITSIDSPILTTVPLPGEKETLDIDGRSASIPGQSASALVVYAVDKLPNVSAKTKFIGINSVPSSILLSPSEIMYSKVYVPSPLSVKLSYGTYVSLIISVSAIKSVSLPFAVIVISKVSLMARVSPSPGKKLTELILGPP